MVMILFHCLRMISVDVYVECYESDRWAIRYVCRDGTIFDSIQTVSSHERASIICDVLSVMYGIERLPENED